MNKIVGLDIGKKRIGISISDIMGLIAHPVETIQREPENLAIEKIKKICKENNVKKIVAGLPKNMNNTIGEQAQDCIDFANNFKDEYEIIFEDERLTSKQAEYILAQTGRKYTKDKKLVDLKSACIILQQYLDSPRKNL
ncbi:TPA: Holliday junction resolvase RuvX [Candidatus Avigastranaerophilus faecigallinarum]|nr:Holliday junction resolvase RuvX [Candidatus Avigastranaerophilus faecigallinarum]